MVTMSASRAPAAARVRSMFLNDWRTWASKSPARDAPASFWVAPWPATQIVVPPSVTTAGEKARCFCQVPSMWRRGMAISVVRAVLCETGEEAIERAFRGRLVERRGMTDVGNRDALEPGQLTRHPLEAVRRQHIGALAADRQHR